MAAGGVTTVPVCLLGVDRVRGGLGIGLVEDIMTTRGLLTKEKKSYIAVVSVADEEGTVSPKTRFPSSVVLKEGGGMQDDHLAHIMRVKMRGGHLERERFGTTNDLMDMLKRSVQPGMVVVDQMKKADEARTLEALEVAEALGCSLVLPLPRPADFRERCKKLFGEDRLTVFTRPPSVRKLTYSILESYSKNPLREKDINPELLADLEEYDEHEHVHGEHCNHDHDHDHQHHHHHHGHDHAHDHDHDHDHDHHHHHDHEHGEHCNHDHDHDHHHHHNAEEKRRDQQRLLDAMKLVAKDPAKSVEALKRGNPLFINAVAQLCSIPAPLPEELRSEKIPSTLESSSEEGDGNTGSGYSPYFVEQGAIEALLTHAKSEASSAIDSPRNSGEQALHVARISVILGALVTFVNYSGEDGQKIRERFVNAGGIEVLRGLAFKEVDEAANELGASKFPGLIKLREEGIARGCFAIVDTLQEDGKYLRACDFCGKRESKMEEWKQCGKCRFNAYCSKECQVNDWKEGSHKTLCAPIPGR